MIRILDWKTIWLRLGIRCVRLGCADTEKKRLRRFLAQLVTDSGRHISGVGTVTARQRVVIGICRCAFAMGDNMLCSTLRRFVSRGAEYVGNVSLRMGQCESTMGETEHAAAMWILTREKGSSTGRAGGGSGKGSPEQSSLACHLHQIWCRHSVPIRLDESTRIVRMKKDDVRWRAHVRLLVPRGWRRNG